MRGHNGPPYTSEFTPAVWGSMALHLLVVPTVVATVLFVRRLGAMQAARLSALPERQEHP